MIVICLKNVLIKNIFCSFINSKKKKKFIKTIVIKLKLIFKC